MKPQIEFRHVLGELSVNRNDPCEVVRELISNSYDATASDMLYAPLDGNSGFIFADNGIGLDTSKETNGITPWEAFFSIGKSTKSKGQGIGYKCQGSKLCFASKRILVATKVAGLNKWRVKVVDNPRNNLDVSYDIDPDDVSDVDVAVKDFLGSVDSSAEAALIAVSSWIAEHCQGSGTLIVIDGLDTENFGKHFSVNPKLEDSYVYNYIRFSTRHGDVRKVSASHGYTSSQVAQVATPVSANLSIYSKEQGSKFVPFGFPYLAKGDQKDDVKSPQQISRLRDGRFYARAAKSFSASGKKYTIIVAVDGNRRAHEEYASLDRKGKAKSGVRLGDHRGAFISVNGIKICKHLDLLASMDEYSVLAEGDSSSHYMMVIDGDFDLVTNRNALSKKAFDELSDPDLVKKVKDFLDSFRSKDSVFGELIARLRRESSENLLNEQIDLLNDARARLKDRDRLRFVDAANAKHLVLSPMPGEEYLVGVLYASLGKYVPEDSEYKGLWDQVLTFSTQGIDSLALKDPSAHSPLAAGNIKSVEYKYDFHNGGPFNHAIAVVDTIVAWTVTVDVNRRVKDTYTCSGDIRVIDQDLTWEIYDIENDDGGTYPDSTVVICLKELIERSFKVKFKKPG